jgi:hypothetical protein
MLIVLVDKCVPQWAHFKVAKRIFQYIRRTTRFGIIFLLKEILRLEGFVDSD